MDAINPIIAEIERRARLQGHSLTSLAKAAGLADTTLTKMKKEPHGAPSLSTLKKLGRILHCSHHDFETHGASSDKPEGIRGDVRLAPARLAKPSQMRKDLPVKGIVAGALANNGFGLTGQVDEYVSRPPALEGSPDAYALRVIGSSMEPLHRPGDLCIIHPHRPYRRGDSVIVQVRDYEGAIINGYIKAFKRETDDMVYCEQFNPPAEVAFKKISVVSVHKVLTVAEILGA